MRPRCMVAECAGGQRDRLFFQAERRMRLVAWAVAIPGAACIALGMLGNHWSSASWLLIVSASGYILLGAAIALWARQRMRTALDAYDHNFLVCPKCRYDLRHLAERGKCPECGEPYRYDELPDIWRNELGEVEIPPEEIVRRVLERPATEYENRRLQPGSGRLLPRDAKK